MAETHFTMAGVVGGQIPAGLPPNVYWVEAEPLTGRSHQIRVHASENGFPVLGDSLYGGTAAPRLFLHSARLAFSHPATDASVCFEAPAAFEKDPRLLLRTALIDPAETNAFRLCHGAADAWPGFYADRLGDFILAQTEAALNPPELAEAERLTTAVGARGLAWQPRPRRVRPHELSPRPLRGNPVPPAFTISENGIRFEIRFSAGSSVGLFLDQRDNRRRLLCNHVGSQFPLFPGDAGGCTRDVLNTFAYTSGFSVCAALAGARVTSIDLSRNYLDWGKRNFELNQVPLAGHEFIFGDVFDWLRRFARQGKLFNLALLDPPTFSQSRVTGAFRAEKDYGKLAAAALTVLRPGGVLFASTNAVDFSPENFLAAIESAVVSAKRKILQRLYVPQPADFPISRSEPAYLKTVWLRIS